MDAEIGFIDDVEEVARPQRDPDGVFELPGIGAEAAEFAAIRAGGAEILHAVIVRIGYVDVTVVRIRDARRGIKVTVLVAVRTPRARIVIQRPREGGPTQQ